MSQDIDIRLMSRQPVPGSTEKMRDSITEYLQLASSSVTLLKFSLKKLRCRNTKTAFGQVLIVSAIVYLVQIYMANEALMKCQFAPSAESLWLALL
jgi:hypothetical protein